MGATRTYGRSRCSARGRTRPRVLGSDSPTAHRASPQSSSPSFLPSVEHETPTSINGGQAKENWGKQISGLMMLALSHSVVGCTIHMQQECGCAVPCASPATQCTHHTAGIPLSLPIHRLLARVSTHLPMPGPGCSSEPSRPGTPYTAV